MFYCRDIFSEKILLMRLMQVLMFIGLLLSLYHFMIQMGVASSFCSREKISIDNLSKLTSHLKKLPSCSKSSWSLFSIPISAYNAAISLGMILVMNKLIQISSNQNKSA
ncbi:MAG: disulfide bond formation protein B [Simkaniaceae bacterium]|nr:disulfide bond formation protein B [Simkaniaceae bacterium]